MATVFEMPITCASKGGGNAAEFRSPDSLVVAYPDGRIVITGLDQRVFDFLRVGTNYTMTVTTIAVARANEPTPSDQIEAMRAQQILTGAKGGPVGNTGSFEEIKKEEVSIKDRIEALSRAQQHQTKVIPPTPPYRR